MNEGPLLVTTSDAGLGAPRRTFAQMAGYAVAQIGGSIFLYLPAMLLMPFLTNALAVPAAFAGFVIFLPKVWVIVCDPLMGIVSDRLRAREIPRTKLAVWGGVGMAILLPVLFSPILLPTPWARGLFVLIAYILGSTVFSAFSVPYLILASEVAVDGRDRTRLLALRQSANYVGALLANYAPALVQLFGGGRPAFLRMGLVFGAICFATTSSVLSVRELVKGSKASISRPSIAGQFSGAVRHKRFRLLLGAYAFQTAAVGVIAASFLYFVIYRLGGDLLLVSKIATCMTFAGIAAQFLWVSLESRIGAWRTYCICVLGMALGDFSFIFLAPETRVLAYPIAMIVGLFSSGFAVMAWTMLLGVMADAHKDATGAQEGALAGIWSASEKVAMATGALLGGIALQWTGFKPSTIGFVPQSAQAILGIRLVTTGLTGLLLLLSLVFLVKLKRADRSALA